MVAPLNEAHRAFLAAYEAGTVQAAMAGPLRVWCERVVFEVAPFQRDIHLGLVLSLYKGCGDGSRALDWFVATAREHRVSVVGVVKRLGTGGLGHAELRQWYARHGFTVARNGLLTLPVVPAVCGVAA